MVASPIEIFEFGNPLAIGGPTAINPHDFALGMRIQQLALEISNGLPDEVRACSQLLRSNVRSAFLVRNLFTIQPPASTPSGFVDQNCGSEWWHCANTAAAFSRALDIHLCSYLSENEGNLFVHLVPTEGSDRGAIKSRKGLRGHTDASALPIPGEQIEHDGVGPSPDLVILVGIRNPKSVATRVAPLSTIIRKLSATTIATLQEPLFDFFPQASFAMAQNYVNSRKPIIVRDHQDGFMIRFSHSNVLPSNENNLKAKQALDELKSVLDDSFQEVVVNPGDVLFVNNRTALHGRAEVGEATPGSRWLLRVYGMYSDPSLFPRDQNSSYMLKPERGGPAAKPI